MARAWGQHSQEVRRPAFQGWVGGTNVPSDVGTTEARFANVLRTNLGRRRLDALRHRAVPSITCPPFTKPQTNDAAPSGALDLLDQMAILPAYPKGGPPAGSRKPKTQALACSLAFTWIGVTLPMECRSFTLTKEARGWRKQLSTRIRLWVPEE
jgi:hypothetical protein